MVAIKDMEIPSDCYDCPFAKNKRTNDYGSFCECGILEDYETINLYEHSKHPNCPLVEIKERKVGKWINKSHKSGCGILFVASECTCCRKKTLFNCDELLYNYCPNCGAEMRAKENESK